LEEQSEVKGISPTLSKFKVKRIGVFQKFKKTKQSEVKPFQIVQDRSRTKIFVSYFEEEEKRKKTILLFLNESKKNEYNRSSTIEDLPLLVWGSTTFFTHYKTLVKMKLHTASIVLRCLNSLTVTVLCVECCQIQEW
jgi:hypothetical protein